MQNYEKSRDFPPMKDKKDVPFPINARAEESLLLSKKNSIRRYTI